MRALPTPPPLRPVLIGLALGLVVGLVTGATPAVADTAVADTTVADTAPPAPIDARDAEGGQQRWDPPLAGGAVRVELRDGTARLSTARDASEERSSLRGAGRQGFLDLGTHQFGSPVNRVDVPVAADTPPGTSVAADVRGQGPDGQWSEWVPAAPGHPARLDEPAQNVAVRLVLTAPAAPAAPPGTPGAPGPTAPAGPAGPVARSVTVLADRVATGPRVITPRASYRVFATREGLVGGTTANGHRIAPNDQFVALPSRRALSPNGRGDYSVRICAEGGRCATVPVWDVGPWNVTDDYWNPAAVRQSWKDLPQGRPQAQAAFENDHNGGKDGFGRDVKNPAGIDVADGTFAAIGLRTNGFVTVDYLWTARSAPVGLAVSPGVPVTLRGAPRGAAPDVGVVGDGAQVEVTCAAVGDTATGSQGTGNLWLRLAGTSGTAVPAPAQYAPATSFRDLPPVPACTG